MNDCLVFQIGVSDVCTVGADIIVHQNIFLTDRTRIWPHKLVPFSIAHKSVFLLTLMPAQTMTEPLP